MKGVFKKAAIGMVAAAGLVVGLAKMDQRWGEQDIGNCESNPTSHACQQRYGLN